MMPADRQRWHRDIPDHAATTPSSTGDVSVLVVDDDLDIRSAILEILEGEGYSTLAAPNGAVALELLRTRTPRLILLDLSMPVMSGAEFRRIQLEDLNLASLPTVVMTARANVGTQLQGLFASAYLAKPVKLDDLLRMVDHYCG
jgi:CheY-like chemotaxis protein